MVAELGGRFDAIFRDIVEGLRTKAASAKYGPCMAARGYSVRDRNDLVAQVREGFADLVNAETGRLAVASSDARFAQRKSMELRAAEADATCRSDAHRIAMGLLHPRLVDFEERYADDLSRLDAEWQQTRNRAEAEKRRIDW